MLAGMSQQQQQQVAGQPQGAAMDLQNSNGSLLVRNQHQAMGTKNKKLFPQKLWDLINDAKYNFCLRWSDDGQLVYLNRDEFEDSYLRTSENQFHTQKAISFVRQMNMYGFRKVDDCYYENDNFKRNCEHLLRNMIRKHPNKGQPAAEEVPPFLFRESSSLSSALPSTNPQAAANFEAAAASILAPSNFLLDCGQQRNSKQTPFNRSDQISRTAPAHQAYNSASQEQGEHAFSGTSERLNDDSLSSSGDYSCSIASGSSEILSNTLDRTESNNHNLHENGPAAETAGMNHEPQTHHQLDSFTGFSLNDPLNLFYRKDSFMNDSMNIINRPENKARVSMPMKFEHQIDEIKTSPLSYDDSLSNELSAFHQRDAQNVHHGHYNIPASGRVCNKMFPSDLTTANKSAAQSNQTNGGNLNLFYTLLSSINSNLYQPVAHLPENQQTLAFDFDKASVFRQVYQQILANQERLASAETVSLPLNLEPLQDPRILEHSLSVSTLGRDILSNALSTQHETLASLKYGDRTFPKDCAVDYQSDNSYRDKHKSNAPLTGTESVPRERRDAKTSRSFKRSIDSILDSNNNANIVRNRQDPSKKLKIHYNGDQIGTNLSPEDLSVSEHAKNLVAEIAFSREARIDPKVISEVSRYTERFVETLFDTAQVIARHSNASASIDSNSGVEGCNFTEELDQKNNRELEKSNISLSDLTSALKLLPSKISRIIV